MTFLWWESLYLESCVLYWDGALGSEFCPLRWRVIFLQVPSCVSSVFCASLVCELMVLNITVYTIEINGLWRKPSHVGLLFGRSSVYTYSSHN